MRIFGATISFYSRFSVCVIIAFLCSCTQHYSISVDTYADNQFIPCGFKPGSSFAILPAKEESPMFSKELSQKIEKILKDRGYMVENFNRADYVLIFKSGMSDAATTTIHIPIGGLLVSKDQPCFAKGVAIYIYDAKMYRRHGKEEQIWSGMAISSGKNSDLRDVIDYLLVAVFNYFGDNTKNNVEINMAEDDEQVRKLRSELEVILPSGLAPLMKFDSGTVLMKDSVKSERVDIE